MKSIKVRVQVLVVLGVILLFLPIIAQVQLNESALVFSVSGSDDFVWGVKKGDKSTWKVKTFDLDKDFENADIEMAEMFGEDLREGDEMSWKFIDDLPASYEDLYETNPSDYVEVSVKGKKIDDDDVDDYFREMSMWLFPIEAGEGDLEDIISEFSDSYGDYGIYDFEVDVDTSGGNIDLDIEVNIKGDWTAYTTTSEYSTTTDYWTNTGIWFSENVSVNMKYSWEKSTGLLSLWEYHITDLFDMVIEKIDGDGGLFGTDINFSFTSVMTALNITVVVTVILRRRRIQKD